MLLLSFNVWCSKRDIKNGKKDADFTRHCTVKITEKFPEFKGVFPLKNTVLYWCPDCQYNLNKNVPFLQCDCRRYR